MFCNLIPTYYAQKIFQIDYDYLLKTDTTNVFFDLDNTLSAYYEKTPDEKLVLFIENLKKQGFLIFLISNNHEERVATFAKPLAIPYLYSAKKPGKKRLKALIDSHQLNYTTCVLIGDQLLTDVICANKIGIKSILVEPFVQKDLVITRFNRFFDKIIRRYLMRKNRLKSIEKELHI